MRKENEKSEKSRSRATRGSRTRALLEHSKQVLWALLLVYIILLGLVFLFGKEVGYGIALWTCLAVAGLVTVTFASIFLLDLLRIIVTDLIEKRRQIKNNDE
jgi:hypothetical protein